jgi:hypothetical protein
MTINIFQYATAAGFAVTTYNTYGSPYASLVNSEKRLKKVKSRFKELSPEQRLEIEAAIQSQDSECKSLDDLQQQLKEYVLPVDAISLSSLNSRQKFLAS